MSQSAPAIGVLRLLGDPILRRVCDRVEASDANLHELVRHLHIVAGRWQAMGLTANQIGGTQRVFVARIRRKLTTFVNPSLIGDRGPLTLFTEEGCLSIPNFRTSTRRHAFVTVEWQGEDLGAVQRGTFSDDEAQAIQHELDHLDGKLIVDGLSRQQRRQAERCVLDYVAATHLAGTKMPDRATPLHGTLAAVTPKTPQKPAISPVNIAGSSGGNEVIDG